MLLRSWLSFLAGDKVSLEGFKELYISRVPGSSVEVEHKGKMTHTCEKVLNLMIIKEIHVRTIYKIDKRQTFG